MLKFLLKLVFLWSIVHRVCPIHLDGGYYFYSKLEAPKNLENWPVPPMLSVIGTYEEIKANSTFQVDCTGNRPIDWRIRPDYYGDGGEINILESVDAHNRGFPYSSKLILSNAQYSDTTLYSCLYNETNLNPKSDNADLSASVYLYVNDDEHLLTPLYTIISAYPSEVLVIPCRTSNSKANVTLWKDDGHGEVMVNLEDGHIHYDPQRGFVINIPHVFFSGMFVCKANLGDIEYDSANVILQFYPSSSENPRPLIEEVGTENAKTSSSFTLNCVVDIELTATARLTWNYPGKLKGNSSGRYLIGKTQISKYNGTNISAKQLQRRITVLDAKTFDEGFYTCQVSKDFEETETSVFLVIADSDVARNLAPGLFVDWLVWVVCFSCETIALFSFSRYI